MSNRSSGYYRKNGTWVSPDGYGRKRGGGNNGGDFYSYLIIGLIIVFLWLISKCSN